ncbi:DUF1853 family protein [Winogradskyella alexanderae]|uniref:DUF1853 family protein n=1 Tax=Winogradskyella alexanderae TaxID=2877123 RepID=A0ABS7XSN0_9FLAO|nr:DUF1853 family protein [Winogradskyella alexanderae]MCA0132780.1 DUF1853 family protein [Winogradskyella alexanderae]
MSNKTTLIEMFEGFQTTPPLWHNDEIYGINQFEPKKTNKQFFTDIPNLNLRLGNWVEKFVSFQLKASPEAQILAENSQIKVNNETIGELDLLFYFNHEPLHMEVVYKFYLFDNKIVNDNYLDKWIGPNRKDTLVFKLKKLKEKQLPLLYHDGTIRLLNTLNVNRDDISQHTCFKAQLFLPYGQNISDIGPINNNCIIGEYLNFDDLNKLRDFYFYIPSKLDWLCNPKIEVEWKSFEDIKHPIDNLISKYRSPLCWVKTPEKELKKIFVTWW